MTPTGDSAARVPILMYHAVSPRTIPGFEKYIVHPRRFARQMQWLAWAGYEPIDLDALLAARTGGRALPRKPVVITFDDGLLDLVEFALPVLETHRFTAVFFLVAGLTGQTARWLTDEIGIDPPLLDWTAARDLLRRGFRCGCHTLTHPHLTRLTDEACREELAASRTRLERELGQPVDHLAYPFGDYDERVRSIADAVGFRSACSVRQGLSGPNDDRLALRRVPIDGSDTLPDFINRLRRGETVRASLRGRYLDTRRRLQTTVARRGTG